MSDQFFLDAEGTNAVGREQQARTNRLAEAFAHLESTLTEYHGCWGDDDIGSTFAGNYLAPQRDFRTSTSNTIDNMSSWSRVLPSYVDEFSDLDARNAERLDHLQAEAMEKQAEKQEQKEQQKERQEHGE